MTAFTPFSQKTVLSARLVLIACTALVLHACSSDLNSELAGGGSSEPIVIAPEPDNTPAVTPDTGAGQASNSEVNLQIGISSVLLVEGAEAVSIPVTVTRTSANPRTVTLTAQGATSTDERQMTWRFDDATLAANEDSTNLVIQLGIATGPISAQSRTFLITANDGNSTPLVATLDIQVQPTSLADVYLLVGQSNTIGFSLDGAKQDLPGQLDAPDPRISQLNVTGNDDENFGTAADFTNPASVHNAGQPVTPAVDPLHDGFDTLINGKVGTKIGFGLSFARAALVNTTADILLVPAAWSDTGFCSRDTNRLPGIGWSATQNSNNAFAGTLLHDRAITRANVALAETGGILRGILWHQGEADSDNPVCAQAYAANLTELVTSLRTNIDQDARGAVARGSNSDIPFIVGTMSMGADATSNQIPFTDTKNLVDAAHRTIANLVTNSSFVNNDDLVPPAFPCGEGSCIHFGATAYREMGQRYYDRLNALLQ